MRNDSVDNLRLDLSREKIKASISVRKGDTKSRTMHLALASNGLTVSLDEALFAELLITKPDGNECDQNMVIVGNELQYTWRSQDVNVEGVCKCQAKITYTDGAVLTSPVFDLVVYDQIVDQLTQKSMNEYTAITEQVVMANQFAGAAEKSAIDANSSMELATGAMELACESRDKAKESEEASFNYMTAANTASQNAGDFANLANDYMNSAKRSEENALLYRNVSESASQKASASAESSNLYMNAAQASAANALNSEVAAKESETAADLSAKSASDSEQKADEYQQKAKEYLDEMGAGQLVLGETSSTAYRGDRGKVAFDHSQASGNPHATTYEDVGADPAGEAFNQASGAYQNATGYTDQKIAELINGAPTTLDTLKEIADAMQEHEEVVEALNAAIGSKANEVEFQSHNNNETIHITADERAKWNEITSALQRITALESIIGYPYTPQ